MRFTALPQRPPSPMKPAYTKAKDGIAIRPIASAGPNISAYPLDFKELIYAIKASGEKKPLRSSIGAVSSVQAAYRGLGYT